MERLGVHREYGNTNETGLRKMNYLMTQFTTPIS